VEGSRRRRQTKPGRAATQGVFSGKPRFEPGERKGNGAVGGSGSTPTELNRLESLESTVNRLTQLLGQQSLMGQLGSVNSINSSNSVTTHNEINNPNEKLGSECCTAPKSNNSISLVKIKAQHVNNSLTCRMWPELPNVLNKCLVVGFAPKIAPTNCTKWILDSGATDHMTGNQKVLRNYRLTQNDQYFTIINNEKIKIKGWGMISIFSKCFLQDVFLVENCSVNLLSISKLTKKLYDEIIFKENIMVFQDLIPKEKIGEGFLENELYFLDSNKFSFNITKDEDLGKLWHKCVGHPFNKILKTIFNFANLDCNNCEICKLAKHTKLSFCDSKTNNSEPLELVHSDVWGHAPVSFYNDYRYFVIFIDDYSRTT
jgi:GAG-pre-integrase domain